MELPVCDRLPDDFREVRNVTYLCIYFYLDFVLPVAQAPYCLGSSSPVMKVAQRIVGGEKNCTSKNSRIKIAKGFEKYFRNYVLANRKNVLFSQLDNLHFFGLTCNSESSTSSSESLNASSQSSEINYYNEPNEAL